VFFSCDFLLPGFTIATYAYVPHCLTRSNQARGGTVRCIAWDRNERNKTRERGIHMRTYTYILVKNEIIYVNLIGPEQEQPQASATTYHYV
jgi:hypothetical protein